MKLKKILFVSFVAGLFACHIFDRSAFSSGLASESKIDDKLANIYNTNVLNQRLSASSLTVTEFNAAVNNQSDKDLKQKFINDTFYMAALNYQFDIMESILKSDDLPLEPSVVNKTFLENFHCKRVIQMMLESEKGKPDGKTLVRTYHITITTGRDEARKVMTPYYDNEIYQRCKGCVWD